MGREYKFYCVKCRESFTDDDYEIRVKTVKGKKRRFAVAEHWCGTECWRVLSQK